MNGAELIAAERERQITKEGWTPAHDDEHAEGELGGAASAYITVARHPEYLQCAPAWWPWETQWWKPSDDPVRNLAKAGALIAAEIDRLQRLAASGSLSGKQR